jgi:hypothetical protein
MDSNPTLRAIIVDSYHGFISSTKDKGTVKDLQEPVNIQSQQFLPSKLPIEIENL